MMSTCSRQPVERAHSDQATSPIAFLTILLTGAAVSMQFVDMASSVVTSLDGEPQDGPRGWFGEGGDAKARERQMRVLRSFIESFVTEEFLPEVYVDFRWACPAALLTMDILQEDQVVHWQAAQLRGVLVPNESLPLVPSRGVCPAAPLYPFSRGGTVVGLMAACCRFSGQCRAMLHQAWSSYQYNTAVKGLASGTPAAGGATNCYRAPLHGPSAACRSSCTAMLVALGILCFGLVFVVPFYNTIWCCLQAPLRSHAGEACETQHKARLNAAVHSHAGAERPAGHVMNVCVMQLCA